MFDRVKEILGDYVEVPKEMITLEASLVQDLQLSSIDVASVVVTFEDEFELEIPDRRIFELQTVGDIVHLLEEYGEGGRNLM